jgi:hypothetical protein
VIAAERPALAEVDLASGAVRMHELTVARTALQELDARLTPAAEAKGAEGPVR